MPPPCPYEGLNRRFYEWAEKSLDFYFSCENYAENCLFFLRQCPSNISSKNVREDSQLLSESAFWRSYRQLSDLFSDRPKSRSYSQLSEPFSPRIPWTSYALNFLGLSSLSRKAGLRNFYLTNFLLLFISITHYVFCGHSQIGTGCGRVSWKFQLSYLILL